MKAESAELTMPGAVEGLKELLAHLTASKGVKHETWCETKLKNAIWILQQQIKPVAPMQPTEYDIMKEMKRLDNEIDMYNQVVRLEMVHNGGEITIKVDRTAYDRLMYDQLPGVRTRKYLIGLYVVNKAQYNEIKESFNQST